MHIHTFSTYLQCPIFRSHEQESLLENPCTALLDGVNSQAVLTDYMIRFVDIIFSHKSASVRTNSEKTTSQSRGNHFFIAVMTLKFIKQDFFLGNTVPYY